MPRKRCQNESSGEGGGGEGNWMNTYGDLVTLLLTFFVLLYSFSSIDAAKWEALVASFSGSSGVFESQKNGGNKTLPAESSLDWNRSTEPDPLNGDGNLNNDNHPDTISTTDKATPTPGQGTTVSPSPMATPTAKPTPKPTPKPTKKPTPKPTQTTTVADPGLSQLYQDLDNYLTGAGLDVLLEISNQNQEILIRLVASVIFEPGTDQLKPDAAQILAGAAVIIKTHLALIESLRTEGHTDSVTPPEGDIDSKWELAACRSAVVLDFLVRNCEINPTIAYTVGYGSTRPIASDDTTAGQDQNNRVDIIMIS